MKVQGTTILQLMAALSLTATPVSAATWYIKADGTGDAATIQAGIAAAANGDTVLLAPGTFTGVGNRDINLLGKAVVVRGEFGPTSTTINCQNLGRGFNLVTGEGWGTVITGLTIKNGLIDKGAGIHCDGSAPRIIGNIIEGNYATNRGGGIYVKGGSPLISNNTFVGNRADAQGSGIHATGTLANPTISYNIFAYGAAGGAITCTAPAVPVVSCNDIFGNAGGDSFCGTDGGGNAYSDPEFCGVPGSGNYYIQSDSPCAPGMSACGSLVGALPVNCATVDVEETTWGAIKELFK